MSDLFVKSKKVSTFAAAKGKQFVPQGSLGEWLKPAVC